MLTALCGCAGKSAVGGGMCESVDVTGGYAEEDAVFDEMGLGKWLLISVLKSGGNVVSIYMPDCMVRAVL